MLIRLIVILFLLSLFSSVVSADGVVTVRQKAFNSHTCRYTVCILYHIMIIALY